MKNLKTALLAAVLIVSSLLISGGAAQASGSILQSSTAVVSAANAAADTGMLIEPLEVVTIQPPLRPDVRPVTLAQLEDQFRRPELQASLNKGSIAVVYPNVEEPFRSAFLAMIQGIEDRIKFKVRAYPVDPKVDTAELNNTLKRSGTKVVIALGRQGLNATAGFDREISVLAGGVLLLSESENVMGISMTPDPAMLFSRLRVLLPELRRIVVVYNPQKSDWLIRLAREAAKAQNIELSAHVAGDLASAAKLYSQLITSADNRHDAIWLPHDSTTVEESTILPLVLRESWNSNLPLFSSNVLHVKKGALFAMVPDNVELGRTLAASAMGVIAGEVRRRPLVPLRELQTAINLRTASHIGLNLGALQQRSFDFVYPQP
jgi:putative ABC transport system substrate-binding protein